MDVLRFIKDDHERIRGLFKQFESVETPDDTRRAMTELLTASRAYQTVEQGHILPEFSAFLSDRDQATIAACQKQCDELKSAHDELLKDAAKALAKARSFDALRKRVLDLKAKTLSHFEQIEQELMPRVRQSIPTQDREDMGVVFQDLRDEAVGETQRVFH